MEIDSWKLIKGCHQPSPQEAEQYFSSYVQVPFGNLLVNTFKVYTNLDDLPEKWMVGSGIMGNVATTGIKPSPSMRLYANDPNLSLEIYNWPIDDIPQTRHSVVGGAARVLAEITTRPADLGVWKASEGHKMRWTIDIGFSNIYLPSKIGKWVLKTVSDFAQQASEFYDPLYEQPVIWDGKPLGQ